MKTIKNFWGIIPIAIVLFFKTVLFIIEKSTNLVLRDTPDCILFWLLLLSVLILIIYVIIRFFSWDVIKKHKFLQIIRYIIFFLYGIGACITLFAGMLLSAFAYCPEEVVVENGVKMVTRDTSYLGFSMEYYKYENAFFRGDQMLKEIQNKTYWIFDADGKLIETGIIDN